MLRLGKIIWNAGRFLLLCGLLGAQTLFLAGCATPLAGPSAIIRYQQIGACNGFGPNNAGANAAFLLFQIDAIDNSQSGAAFNFDPTKLFVAGPTREYLSTSTPVATAVLGSRKIAAQTIANGNVATFPPASYGFVTVATSNPNGAAEASRTSYFLNYDAGPNDPSVLLLKLTGKRSVWPGATDCSSIPLNDFLYLGVIPTSGSSYIQSYQKDPATGALSALASKPPAACGGSDVAGESVIDPRSRRLYLLCPFSASIYSYALGVDGAPGTGTKAADLSNLGSNLFSVAIDPGGRFLFVMTDVNIVSIAIDSSGGLSGQILTPLQQGLLISGPSQILVNSTGRFVYALTGPAPNDFTPVISGFTIDQNTGALTPFPSLPTPTGLGSAAWGIVMYPAGGYLYAFSAEQNGKIAGFSIDEGNAQSTGALKPLPGAAVQAGSFPSAMTFDAAGGFAYVTNTDMSNFHGTISAYAIGQAGALKPGPGSVTGPANADSIVADATGRFLFAVGAQVQTVNSYLIDPKTGALTQTSGIQLNSTDAFMPVVTNILP